MCRLPLVKTYALRLTRKSSLRVERLLLCKTKIPFRYTLRHNGSYGLQLSVSAGLARAGHGKKYKCAKRNNGEWDTTFEVIPAKLKICFAIAMVVVCRHECVALLYISTHARRVRRKRLLSIKFYLVFSRHPNALFPHCRRVDTMCLCEVAKEYAGLRSRFSNHTLAPIPFRTGAPPNGPVISRTRYSRLPLSSKRISLSGHAAYHITELSP